MEIKFIELKKRVTNFLKQRNVYANGENNDYPNLIESFIENSVTATQCRNKLVDFLVAKGFSENPIVNEVLKLRLYDIKYKISRDIATHYGCYIHINFILRHNKFVPQLNVLNYKNCRIGKGDYKGGKRNVIYENLELIKRERKTQHFFHYSSNKDVITQQINTCRGSNFIEKLKNYQGQVLFLNLSEFLYPLGLVHPARLDSDTEYRISLHRNSIARTGFLGQMIVRTKGLDKTDKEKIQNQLRSMLGADKVGIAHIDLQAKHIDSVKDIIDIQTLKPLYDDKLFDLTEKRISNNIRKCFKNIPKELVDNESGLFSNNGDLIKTLSNHYWNETSLERDKIDSVLSSILNIELKTKPFQYD